MFSLEKLREQSFINLGFNSCVHTKVVCFSVHQLFVKQKKQNELCHNASAQSVTIDINEISILTMNWTEQRTHHHTTLMKNVKLYKFTSCTIQGQINCLA